MNTPELTIRVERIRGRSRRPEPGKRRACWAAWLHGHRDQTALGRSKAEAVGNLVLKMAEEGFAGFAARPVAEGGDS